MSDCVLIVGGAGYIGSHMVHYCHSRSVEVVVLDDLSRGHRDAIPSGVCFYQGDMADQCVLQRIFSQHSITSVMHFASLIEVAESMRDPAAYFHCNVTKTLSLIDVVLGHGVRHFIFSSTAAVYGHPLTVPVSESANTAPINPYGRSKLTVEYVLESYFHAYGLQYAAMRYFNAAGAHPQGHLSERHQPETHLIPLLLQVVAGERESFTVFGEDYDTPDGTCIRDFIHVEDLCSAHWAALSYLKHDSQHSAVFNVGNNRGYSVLEVIEAVYRVTGVQVKLKKADRRPGDPAMLVADAGRLQRYCRWQAEFTDIDTIIAHAWQAKKKRMKQLAGGAVHE